jgi:hypothetical protein
MRHANKVLAAGMVVVALLAYPAGYFWLCDYREWKQGDIAYPEEHTLWAIERTYPSQLFYGLFMPAAWLEAQVRGIKVELNWPGSGQINNFM